MTVTNREFWTIIHGLVLGTLFLLAFGGGLAGFWSLKERLVTADGVGERTPRLLFGTSVMAVVAWLTALTGAFIAYPWYRAKPPESIDATVPSDALAEYPRSFLLANPNTHDRHAFGMEWKEHVAWIAPTLATVVAFVVIYYGTQLIRRGGVRRAVMIFFALAFVSAGVAGLFGAFIKKSAPVF